MHEKGAHLLGKQMPVAMGREWRAIACKTGWDTGTQ